MSPAATPRVLVAADDPGVHALIDSFARLGDDRARHAAERPAPAEDRVHRDAASTRRLGRHSRSAA